VDDDSAFTCLPVEIVVEPEGWVYVGLTVEKA
jgi:hypothetical protein